MNGTIPQSTPSVNGHSAPVSIDALCSMNGFVKVGRHETRDHQCTGRGATPEEAAANFFGCMDALEAGYAARAARTAAPPPLASRTQRLSLLLACGIEKALAKQDGKMIERLMKAAALVLAGRVVQLDDGTYQVRSLTEPETTAYIVAGSTCTCQDAKKHEGERYYCKHATAVAMVARLDAQEYVG